MNEHEKEQFIGHTAIATTAFITFVREQTQDGCAVVPLAAGIATALEQMAAVDPGCEGLRTILATLLKDHAK